MIVGPHSTKLPQSWDTESDQLGVPACFQRQWKTSPMTNPMLRLLQVNRWFMRVEKILVSNLVILPLSHMPDFSLHRAI